MELQPSGLLQLNYFRGSYPFQLQPTISVPDYLVNAIGGNATDIQGMTPDPVAGCIYAKPVFVPHNQRVTTGTVKDKDQFVNAALPDWTWDTVTGTGCQNFLGNHFGHQTLDSVDTTAPTSATGSTLLSRTLTPQNDKDTDHSIQGFFCFLGQSAFLSSSNSSYELKWKIGSDVYSLKVTSAEFARFRKFVGGGGPGTDIAPTLKMGGPITQAMGTVQPGGALPIVIEVLFINSTLMIKFNGQQVPYSYRIYGVSNPLITQVTLQAQGFTTFSAEIHPMKFLAASTLRSNPIELGFSPQNMPYYFVSGISGTTRVNSGGAWSPGFPTGSTVTVTRVGLTSDEAQQYDLALANTVVSTYNGVTWADRTAAVTRVVIHVDGIVANAATPPVPVIPKRISETITFDPVGLTISQNLDFTLDNFYGQWRGQAGNIAVSLALGYNQPSTALFPRFTGMCGRYQYDRPATERSTIGFSCDSLMKVLSDQMIVTPPLMDGWNHYYAIAYLAQMAGFSLSQMGFAALVPSDPFSASGVDPAPYFLPFGNGMRPWTPRNREQPILGMMNYIRKPTGFLLFFDAQGFLRYEKWLPPSAAAAKRVFTEGDTTSGAHDGDGLTAFWNYSLESTVEDVRNQTLLIGIDPMDPKWSLIINKREDTASIYAAPGSEPKNYLGYKRPFVWVDSRFVSSAFTAQAADTIHAIMRIPGLSARFTTYLQPDLYPMDVIWVQESRSGAESIPFYVMQVVNEWAYEGYTQKSTTTVHGKFLV